MGPCGPRSIGLWCRADAASPALLDRLGRRTRAEAAPVLAPGLFASFSCSCMSSAAVPPVPGQNDRNKLILHMTPLWWPEEGSQGRGPGLPAAQGSLHVAASYIPAPARRASPVLSPPPGLCFIASQNMPPPSLPVTGVCYPFLTPTGPQLCGQHVQDPGQGKFTPPLLPIPATLECLGCPTPSHLPQGQCPVPSPCQLGWGGPRSVLLVRQGSFLSHRRSQELRSSRSSGLVAVRKRQMRRERSGPTLRGRPTPPVFTGRSARRARRS